MKMLMIVFRESIVQHIHALLKEYDVTSFSEIHNVEGKGETGPAVKSFFSPGATALSQWPALRHLRASGGTFRGVRALPGDRAVGRVELWRLLGTRAAYGRL